MICMIYLSLISKYTKLCNVYFSGGFLYVDDIFQKVQKLRRYTLEDVKHVVESNDKQRFSMEQDKDGHWMIRANQGHSIEVG